MSLPTAALIKGGISRGAGTRSSALPPWFETITALTPIRTHLRASSGVRAVSLERREDALTTASVRGNCLESLP